MSRYTTEVRFICEEAAGLTESVGYTGVNEVLDVAIPKVFNFDFPIFDEGYRPVIEKKILKHYYTREIGLETVGLWKLFLDTKLNEIMPYYNQLYKSQLIEFNPMYDVDISKTNTLKKVEDVSEKATHGTDIIQKVNSNSTNESNENVSGTTKSVSDLNNTSNTLSDTNNTNEHIDKYAETPQGGLVGLRDDTYLTNARIVSDNGNAKSKVDGSSQSHGNDSSDNTMETISNNTTNSVNDTSENRNSVQANTKNLNTIDDYIEHVTGKTSSVSYSSLLQEFRETFINIDMMIINDLSDLFFNLW